MWPAFKTERPFEPLVSLEGDMRLSTLAFGFTLGFGYFVVWHAIKQTRRSRRWSTYIVMCWLEIIACTALGIICWLHICEIIGHSFWFYFWIVTLWALQVQFLLQIIVNRICILLIRSSHRFWLKFAVAIWITAINISVYCIWIPAKLQISDRYILINVYWDHTEKILYLITDAILNVMFICTIQRRLIAVGLKKYDKLVAFNKRIILVSLSMDVLIVGMLSYRNAFVYMQFHPVAYLVKLEIEMCMSHLMVKVAKGTGVDVYDDTAPNTNQSSSGIQPRAMGHLSGRLVNVHVATQVTMHTDNETGEYNIRRSLDEKMLEQDSLKREDLEKGLRRNTIHHIECLNREDTHTVGAIPINWEPRTSIHEGNQIWNNKIGVFPDSENRWDSESERGTYLSTLGRPHVKILHSSLRNVKSIG